VGEPPDERLCQAQREALARASWKDPFPRLEKVALTHGASPSDARDLVRAAVSHLLDGRTTWDCARGPGIRVYLRMAAHRVLSNDRRRPRHRHEAPLDNVEDAPHPHADNASSPEAREQRVL